MRRFGLALMVAGSAVGLAAAIWIAGGIERAGLSWLVGIGLVKLMIGASLGLIATGAIAMRIANRSVAGAPTSNPLLHESVDPELVVPRVPVDQRHDSR